MPDDITSDVLPEGGNLSDAVEAASEAQADNLTLPELNEFLGKDFKSKDAALKSIKDTFRYVGKVGNLERQLSELKVTPQETARPADDTASKVRELESALEEVTFFAERPELSEYKTTLRELRASTGKSLSALAESEAIKPLIEKARAYDDVQKKRSVLESSPRLGQVRDKISESRTLLEKGDTLAAKASAVSSVLDAYDLSK